MNPGGTAAVVLAGDVFIDALEHVLGVPTVESPLGAGQGAIARGIPIVVCPIGVADVEIDDHVVDEVRHVEHFGHGVVGGARREVRARPGEQHVVVMSAKTVFDIVVVVLENVVVFFVAAQVLRGERLIGLFVNVVHAPVDAVDVQMVVTGMRREPAHRVLYVGHELVLNELGKAGLAGAGVMESEVQHRVEHERVEAVGRLVAEDVGIQLGRSPLPLEGQLKRQLVGLPTARAGAALNLDRPVNLKTRAAIGQNLFDRDAPFLAHAVDVDSPSAAAEHVGPGQHQRDRGNRTQVVGGQPIALDRVIDDVRVDRPIPSGMSPGGRRRQTRAVLLQYVVEVQIRLRVDVGGNKPDHERGRTERGGRVDVNRILINLAGCGRRLRSVERVANLRPGRVGRDLDVDRCVIKPAIKVKFCVGHQAQAAFDVGLAGRRRREILERAGDRAAAAQLGQNQKIAAAGRIVQAMNRQDVAARAQQTDVLRDVELLEHRGLLRRSVGRGGRLKAEACRGIARGDTLAVEIGHEAVVVLHPQRERAELLRVGHFERHADIQRTVVSKHRLFDVGFNRPGQRTAGVLSVVADARESRLPGSEVERFIGRRAGPTQRQIVIGRHE